MRSLHSARTGPRKKLRLKEKKVTKNEAIRKKSIKKKTLKASVPVVLDPISEALASVDPSTFIFDRSLVDNQSQVDAEVEDTKEVEDWDSNSEYVPTKDKENTRISDDKGNEILALVIGDNDERSIVLGKTSSKEEEIILQSFMHVKILIKKLLQIVIFKRKLFSWKMK